MGAAKPTPRPYKGMCELARPGLAVLMFMKSRL